MFYALVLLAVVISLIVLGYMNHRRTVRAQPGVEDEEDRR